MSEDVLREVRQHGTSAISSKHGRRLLQPVKPNAVNVRPGQRSDSKTAVWVQAVADPRRDTFHIPSSFLGISHEWTNLDEFYTERGSYLRLIKDLTAYGGGPLVLRVGGGSTDKQSALPLQATWQGLKALQESTGSTT